MKKLLPLLLVAMLALTACAPAAPVDDSQDGTSVTTSMKSEPAPSEPDAGAPAQEDMEYEVFITESTYIAVVLTNTTGVLLGGLEVEVTFMKDGSMIGTERGEYFMVSPGRKLAYEFPKPRDADRNYVAFDDVEVNIKTDDFMAFTEFDEADLKVEHSQGAEDIIIRVTNEGETQVDYVKFAILYYTNGEVNGIGIVTVLEELQPGDTATNSTLFSPRKVEGRGDVEYDDYELLLVEANTW